MGFVVRIAGGICVLIKQPRVVGEIIVGVFLPSIAGFHFAHKLYPSSSDALLDGISSLGIVFFSANVGLDFDRRVLKGLYTKVFVLAFISALGPMLCAIPVLYILPETDFFQPHISQWTRYFF